MQSSVIYQPESTWGNSSFCCELPTDPAHLRSVRRTIRKWAADAGMREGRLDDLLSAVDQAAASGIEHSSGGPGPIWIDGHVALGQIRVVVTDYGPRRASTTAHELDLRMLDGLTDHMHLEHSDGTTAITMVWEVSRIRLSSTRERSLIGDRV